MDIKDITPELREVTRACKTPEEILALAQEYDYDLTMEELEAISGGSSPDDPLGWDSCSSLAD